MKRTLPLSCTLLLTFCSSLLLFARAVCSASSALADAGLTREGPNRRQLLHGFNSSNSLRFQKPYNICISQWMPLVLCTGLGYEDFHGYSVELWEAVAAAQGLEEGIDWSFTCFDTEEALLEDLEDPEGKCTMSATGIELNVETTMSGSLKFSWPFYKSGFSVMVSNRPHKADKWLFGEAFHWSVWILLVLTTVLMGVLVTFAEVLTYGGKANRRGLRGWFWYSLGKMLHFVPNVGDPQTWASRILVLGFGLTILIVAHLFTATIANKMLSERMANIITSKGDLMGRKVGCWTDEVALVRKYGMKAVAFEGEEDLDTRDAMLNSLRLHEVDALILDTPAAMSWTSTAEPACDLFIVGEPFDTFFLSFGFPADAPDALISNTSAAIVQLQLSEALLDQLENEHIKQAGPCHVDDGTLQFHMEVQVGMADVQGLWELMGWCLMGAVLLSVAGYAQSHGWVQKCWRRWRPAGNRVAPGTDQNSMPGNTAKHDDLSGVQDDMRGGDGFNPLDGLTADDGDGIDDSSLTKAAISPAGNLVTSSKHHQFARHLSKLAVGSSAAGGAYGGGGPGRSDDGVLMLSAGAGRSPAQPFDAAVVVQSRPVAHQLDDSRPSHSVAAAPVLQQSTSGDELPGDANEAQ